MADTSPAQVTNRTMFVNRKGPGRWQYLTRARETPEARGGLCCPRCPVPRSSPDVFVLVAIVSQLLRPAVGRPSPAYVVSSSSRSGEWLEESFGLGFRWRDVIVSAP